MERGSNREDETMNIPLHRLAALVYNTPLLITPAKAEVISGVLQAHIEARMSGMPIERKESERENRPSAFIGETLANESGNGRTPYRVKDGKAIITIDGELVNRGEWVGADSGLVSYDGIRHQLAMATKDSRVKSIILDINSPGGEAIGAFDAAAAVRQAAAIKPVTAIANGMAASAAYGLASGATRRIITQDGIGGSIGVVMMHVDMSRALENRGVKPTLIFAGAHKVDGNPFEKLPESVREQMQTEVNHFYDMFVKTVAEGTKLDEQQIRDTEARIFIGQDAVDSGLFDAIATFEDVITGKTDSVMPRVAVPAISQQERNMEKNAQPATAGNLDVAALLEKQQKENSELKAQLETMQAEKKKAEIEKAKIEASAKVDAWERDGRISGNATKEVKSLMSAIAAGEPVTMDMVAKTIEALPKIDTTRQAEGAGKTPAAEAHGVTKADFEKAHVDAKAAKKIAAAVAERKKTDAKFDQAALRKEVFAAA
jgi:signal peptide peptidase SppA